jgi:hypothetical protein
MNCAYSTVSNGTLKLHRTAGFGEVSNMTLRPRTLQKPGVFAIGTAAGNALRHIGGAYLSACKPPNRGGARIRADRESHALTSAQLGNLIAATAYADVIGLPFTRMITIHWQSAGIALSRIAWANGRFLDLLSKTLARQGHSMAAIWVQEGGPNKGGHCHILAHVPASTIKVISRLQRRWLHSITGQRYRARVIKSKPIGGRLGIERTNRELYRENLGAALAYVVKGADSGAARTFKLPRLENSGRCIGKRCGVTQNIGPATRGKADVPGDVDWT